MVDYLNKQWPCLGKAIVITLISKSNFIMKRSGSKLTLSLLFLFLFQTVTHAQEINKLPDWAFGGFVRPTGVNPVISPKENTQFLDPMTNQLISWESNDTFNPAAAVKNGKIIVLYRAEDRSGVGIGKRTSRIGYAESNDGITFKRASVPVLFPGNDAEKENEWPGGCEDPRVAVTNTGKYVMFYTQWNRHVPRLAVATSADLKTWDKHGAIFKKAFDGKFYNIASKSASILTKIEQGKQVITKINGKYWMYWGEEHVYAASSLNLVDWEPLLDGNGKLKQLASPRKGFFDSDLTECGPPAILTKKGIVLLYNGKNSAKDGDKRFPANSYCAGQFLFDLHNPEQLKGRLDLPFLRPMEAFEKSGQYVDGTVFIEGLTYFKNKWYLYYGCADSKVAVAMYDPKQPALPDQ